MPSLRRLVAGFSSRRPIFDPRPLDVRFVVDKITLVQVFLQVLRFSPVSITPPVLHTFGSYQKDKRARPGNLPKSDVLSEILTSRQLIVPNLGAFNHVRTQNSSLGRGADHKVMYILILMLKYNCNITLFVTAFIYYKYNCMFHDSLT
jgi:hypothetical protein